MKLITHPFDGDKRRLREFIENVDVAFELVHPNKHEVLLKFVKTKITGDATSKLMVRDLANTWALVKGILEENFAVRRTLDFYACRMFSVRQERGESVASWGSRIDEMQTELREATRRICKPEEILGAIGLICHLGKACFVQGLNNERIQTTVRSRGEAILLSQAIEVALEEEGAVLSIREKFMAAGNTVKCTNCNRLGHTAGKCVSKDRLPPATVRGVMSVMSYNCGRVGNLAKNCRQRSNKELCGPRSHAEFGRQGTTLGTREPGVPRKLNYADQGGHAEFGRQGTTLDRRETGSAAEAACGVQKRYWANRETSVRGRCATNRIPRREGNRL
jgi:hypothetical protein